VATDRLAEIIRCFHKASASGVKVFETGQDRIRTKDSLAGEHEREDSVQFANGKQQNGACDDRYAEAFASNSNGRVRCALLI